MTDRAQWSGKEGGREAVSSGAGGGRPRWTSTPAVAFGTATSDGLPRPFLLRRPFFVARRRERDPKTERQRARLVEC